MPFLYIPVPSGALISAEKVIHSCFQISEVLLVMIIVEIKDFWWMKARLGGYLTMLPAKHRCVLSE